jgi:predicted nuclease of predicted toxin-antitoxin system
MKFKLDENLPLAARDVFSEAGYDALSVHDQAVAGAADKHLAQICRAEERILVTLDLDFADIRLYPPHDFPGLIVLRLQRQDFHTILAVCRRLLTLLAHEPIERTLWIVGDQQLRIRS